MARKKSLKTAPLLSPANYIRTRARKLPVVECWVNSDWEESQIADLVIARQHSNGNFTLGLYLVDLFCLGVKDTFYYFNIGELEYREVLERYTDLETEKKMVGYELAHNIVFAGLEFADEFGFKPCRDFTSTTQYFLDEDTDAVPLMEIVCGMDGLPTLLPDLWHDKKALARAIHQLEEKAGFGNFLLFRKDGRVMHALDDDYDDDEFSGFTLAEKVGLFKELLMNQESLAGDELDRFNELINSLSTDLMEQEDYDKHYNELSELALAIDVDAEYVPDELLNGTAGQYSEETKRDFLRQVKLIDDEMETGKPSDGFRIAGGAAANGLLGFLALEGQMENVDLLECIDKLAAEYPNYPLVKLVKERYELLRKELDSRSCVLLEASHFFGNRKVVHTLEYLYYLNYLSAVIMAEGDLAKLCAWRDLFDELPVSDVDTGYIMNAIISFQPIVVAEYLRS